MGGQEEERQGPLLWLSASRVLFSKMGLFLGSLILSALRETELVLFLPLCGLNNRGLDSPII